METGYPFKDFLRPILVHRQAVKDEEVTVLRKLRMKGEAEQSLLERGRHRASVSRLKHRGQIEKQRLLRFLRQACDDVDCSTLFDDEQPVLLPGGSSNRHGQIEGQ